jgi:hypothetical protein
MRPPLCLRRKPPLGAGSCGGFPTLHDGVRRLLKRRIYHILQADVAFAQKNYYFRVQSRSDAESACDQAMINKTGYWRRFLIRTGSPAHAFEAQMGAEKPTPGLQRRNALTQVPRH